MRQPLDVTIRMAARALGRHNLVHAYGHCSARRDAAQFLVCPARPMGLVEPGESCVLVPVNGELPTGVLGEVRIHQQIYAARPDAGGVVRFMSPSVMALGALGRVPRIRHGFGTYFAPEIGLWDDIQLVRDDDKARGVLAALGTGAGVLLRGNGAVVTAASLEAAVMLAFYFEDMCRIELVALASGLAETAPLVSPEAAQARASLAGGLVERMWSYLTTGDPETGSQTPSALERT